MTFLFTDVEGSTKLLHELGAEKYAEALAEHRRVIRQACAAEAGVEVDTQGDAFFFAFPTAPGALRSAAALSDGLATGPISVRAGLHTGTPLLTEEGYVGDDIHLAARIAASAHGGQVVISAATAEFADGSLTELGEHRLKDIERAVPIYQLGSETFPPLKTISNTNLPRPASSFVGREREVSEMLALLQDGVRLLTLTGPGGSGKTRLALEAGAELVPEFKAGVFWVGLATLRDHALVLQTITQALGCKTNLQDHIGERELLLLLDNLEQVVEGAPELASLVESCPNLRLLCTSRQLLRVNGEVEYAVLPLAEPEAVSLFCERARLDATDDIAELCGRLDSLPLAVELAAARAKVLSPRQMLERLSQRLDLLKGGRDADPRQRTLRATIEWSYELLTANEQQLFARLAVFAGGCALETAEQVSDADLDTLQSLVEKSLLRFANERYWMLETIREYAARKLDESGEAHEVRQRQAEYFLLLGEEAFAQVRGNARPWLDRLEADHDNLRTVLDWLESVGRTQEALQLAGALYRFWGMRGYLLEGRDRLERLLARERAGTSARLRALTGAAVIASTTGDSGSAERRAEEARELARTLGDAWGETYAGYMLGIAATERKDWSAALPFFEASRDAFRRIGDEHYMLAAMDGIAWALRMLGDRERSESLHEETLAYARAGGYPGVVALQLFQLAEFATEKGRPHEALAMLREALVLNRDEGYLRTIPEVLVVTATALQAVSAAAAAATLLAAAARLRDEIAGGFGWVGDEIERLHGSLRDSLGEGAFESAWKRGRALSTDEAIALALEETERDA